jgi:hypothetical protein
MYFGGIEKISRLTIVCDKENCVECLKRFNTGFFWYCPYGKHPVKQEKKKCVLSDYSFHENDGFEKIEEYYAGIKERKTLRMW